MTESRTEVDTVCHNVRVCGETVALHVAVGVGVGGGVMVAVKVLDTSAVNVSVWVVVGVGGGVMVSVTVVVIPDVSDFDGVGADGEPDRLFEDACDCDADSSMEKDCVTLRLLV